MDDRPKARKFTDLVVWQKTHGFVLNIYKMTATFPREEMHGLTSQFRRAAVSIAANIAEGFRKRSNAEKGRYLNIAQGSLEECRYYLIPTQDLEYNNTQQYHDQLEEVSKVLTAYTNRVLSK